MSLFSGAQNFVLNVRGDLVDNSINQTHRIGSGLELLLGASYPEAFHDSSSHPPSCLPGTRVQYIEDITGWAWALPVKRHLRMMWMQGPAGVGKSALARSCSEKAGTRLAAAFFFSRSNGRDVSTHLFPSIAYQLTTKYPKYRDKLDKKLIYDPSIVDKPVPVQFRELIVAPLRELENEGNCMDGSVIFVDGLDECAGEDAQCTIIDIISSSVRCQTTPFVWAFFSRPEPHLAAIFSTSHLSNICWHLTLPASHDADRDIELYLVDGFRRIQAKYGIPTTVLWPLKNDMRQLVRRSSGLFIYPASIIRFVGEGGPLGPEEQLRSILYVPKKPSGRPWHHLDAFYTLVMEQIPGDILPLTLKLLSLTQPPSYLPSTYKFAADILGLSLSTYCAALSKLHSVVKITYTDTGLPKDIGFYHASFLDFLGDPNRSRKFCVKTPEVCATLLADIIRRLDNSFESNLVRCGAFYMFWEIGSHAKLDEGLLQQLAQCNYLNMPLSHNIERVDVERLFNNIPLTWRKKVMKKCYPSLRAYLARQSDPTQTIYLLGQADKRRGLVLDKNRGYYQLYCPPVFIPFRVTFGWTILFVLFFFSLMVSLIQGTGGLLERVFFIAFYSLLVIGHFTSPII